MGETVIQNRDQLICALHEASELEHLLMCQYLFTALSLKKANEAGITIDQAERTRRWEAKMLMIARQEMEHLALVNNLLLAIGADPYFSRPNFPIKKYLLDMPYYLERFNRESLGRFIWFERPNQWNLDDCGFDPYRLANHSLLSAAPAGIPIQEPHCLPNGLLFNSVQDMYDAIDDAFNNRNQLPALDNLFIGDPNREPFQDFQFNFEFNIFTFPITDRRTANAAINLIMEQGEGIKSQPGFSSHFCTFCDIYQQFQAGGFDPAWNVVENPSFQNVTDGYAQALMAAFNDSYTTMLFMLSSFYSFFSPETADVSNKKISTALQQTAFAPMMTMVVRPLGEILMRLPAGDGNSYAGPNWDIPDSERDLKPTDDPTFFIQRLGNARDQIERLRDGAPSRDVATRLNFMYENLYRVERNFRQITGS